MIEQVPSGIGASEGASMEQASAIYDPMIPMAGSAANPPTDSWYGSPASRCRRTGPMSSSRTPFRVRHRGVAQRGGFTVYEFAGWPPGVTVHRRPIRTVREGSRAAKPALVQRLRVINTHLTLLHGAAMSAASESPTVQKPVAVLSIWNRSRTAPIRVLLPVFFAIAAPVQPCPVRP